MGLTSYSPPPVAKERFLCVFTLHSKHQTHQISPLKQICVKINIWTKSPLAVFPALETASVDMANYGVSGFNVHSKDIGKAHRG